MQQLETLYIGQVSSLPHGAPLRWLILRPLQRAHTSHKPASSIKPICEYTKLQALSLHSRSLGGLPACLAKLTELRYLDAARNKFGTELKAPEDAIPVQLSALTRLVEFSAWGQGLTYVRKVASCPEDTQCVLDVETALSFASDGEVNMERYRCPGKSWSPNLDKLKAIYGWRKLQKFWIDANQITASEYFVREAARAWPQLRTLDLYDNAIEMDVGAFAAFASHPTMYQLYLARNRFFGTFPEDLVDASKTWPLGSITVFMNSNVTGCIPRRFGAITAGSGIRCAAEEL
eukprot:TRINITY_DN15109_c0_g1_i1.p1 TRINITY_DN15109_c0_g1~~TRINITY_DN15109_c0_g1_i1.p1  ORF type:complete len:341 (-),score=47.71 TRINITY_DN15109_c0_g1_i1:237-1106(-)